MLSRDSKRVRNIGIARNDRHLQRFNDLFLFGGKGKWFARKFSYEFGTLCAIMNVDSTEYCPVIGV